MFLEKFLKSIAHNKDFYETEAFKLFINPDEKDLTEVQLNNSIYFFKVKKLINK